MGKYVAPSQWDTFVENTKKIKVGETATKIGQSFGNVRPKEQTQTKSKFVHVGGNVYKKTASKTISRPRTNPFNKYKPSSLLFGR